MKKKITMLLASLFACVGVMKADVTKFYKPGERVATLTAGQQVMFYNTSLVVENGAVSQDRTGFLVDNGSRLELSKTKPAQNPVFSEKVGVWTVESVEDNDTYYKVSVKGSNGYVGIGGVTNNAAARDLYIHKWMEVAADKKAGVGSENAAGETVNSVDITASDNVWLVANGDPDNISNTWNGNTNSFATWSTGHPYAMYSVVEAETTDLEALLATAKSDALTVLGSYAKLTISTAATAITEVNAVVLENNDLEAALNTIDGLVLEAKKSMDGKSLVFDNNGNNGRAGLSVTANKSVNRAYGTTSEADDIIWTIKSQDNGSFKLYSFVADKYLGAPGSNDNSAVLADEAGAAAYEFIVTDANKVALVSDGKMLHQRTAWSPNYDLIDWYDLNDAASLWTITEKEIKVSREQYDLASAAKEILPYAIQQAYGLVTDAANYYSNWKSEAEGSYEALLDNTSDYFHSAYTEEAKAETAAAHYIQANLESAVDQFYFYMAPRNANNRPVNITVSGSNDNVTFEEIKQISTTLASTSSYFSEKLGTAGKSYKYIRLTVTSTNTSTKFFTLSELYFLPAQSDVTNLVDSYNAFASSSITSETMATAATALINAEGTLALSNIKKEIVALLSANEGNHAAAPALGQYTTEAYDALNAAYVAADATQESLEAAIAAFKKSLNAPVYFITSKHNGYAAGSAIYYDGAWKWKAANIYDRQMWMTIPGYTEENVPAVDAYDANGTSYAICDYLTGTKMRGKDVQIVKVADWEGAYNLQYNANASSTDAAQHAKDNGQLVNWKPGTKDDAQASVWGVEYIGNTYDLDKLTDAHVTALSDLQAAYNTKAFYADAVLGEGLGQYKGTEEGKAAIVATLAPAEAILNRTLSGQANTTVDDINAAAAAINEVAGLEINLPEAGKYYRFQGACEASLRGYYITGHTNADGGRIALTAKADASTIYYFDGTNLTAFQSGLVVGLNDSHWTFASIDDNSKPASTITFAGSPRQAGKYTIKSANRYFHYTVYNNTVQVNRCSEDTDKEHDWTITEVTALPVTISAAGYATFYAPVEVTLPAEVTAHTVTSNGEWATLSEGISVVPAENGVILAGVEGTYELAITTTGAEDLDNALAGTVAKTLVSKTEGDAYYVLAKQDENVGLYNPVKGEDATKFYNAGHKAYWHIPAAAQSAGYRFGEGTTGIDTVKPAVENVVIYDLAGRRVEKMDKGIYIVNGRKVVIR